MCCLFYEIFTHLELARNRVHAVSFAGYESALDFFGVNWGRTAEISNSEDHEASLTLIITDVIPCIVSFLFSKQMTLSSLLKGICTWVYELKFAL